MQSTLNPRKCRLSIISLGSESSLVRCMNGRGGLSHLPMRTLRHRRQSGSPDLSQSESGHEAATLDSPRPCAACLGLAPCISETCYHSLKSLLCPDQDQLRLKWASADVCGEQEPDTSPNPLQQRDPQTLPAQSCHTAQPHGHLLFAGK